MDRFVKRLSILFLFAVWLTLSAVPASARDICLGDGGQTLVFRKVKTLRPGGAIPLTGLYLNTVTLLTYPVDGSATMRSNGTVVVGISVHASVAGGANFTIEWETTSSFAGTAGYDLDGDFRADDGTIDLSVLDCRMVVLG